MVCRIVVVYDSSDTCNPTPFGRQRNLKHFGPRRIELTHAYATRCRAARCATAMPMKTVDVLLEERGIALRQLAEWSALDIERVEAIVDGRWLPSPAERQKIAAALGVDAATVSWGHTMNPRNVRYHRFGLKEDFN